MTGSPVGKMKVDRSVIEVVDKIKPVSNDLCIVAARAIRRTFK
jgi:hypothetical protein